LFGGIPLTPDVALLLAVSFAGIAFVVLGRAVENPGRETRPDN